MYGDGLNSSVIKVTTASIAPFYWLAPDPLVDADRITGRILIADMGFFGPGAHSLAKSGQALKFIGAQGIQIQRVKCFGWTDGVFMQQVDIAEISSSWLQSNTNGFNSDCDAASYAYGAGGSMNSLLFKDNIIANNTLGINYYGGNGPIFRDNNFTSNTSSIVISSTAGKDSTTTCPVVEGNYFEADLSNILILGGDSGGGQGIILGGSVQHNSMLITPATTAINVQNISNTIGRMTIGGNTQIATDGTANFTAITQGSIQKADYNGMNGSLYQVGSTITDTKTGVLNGAAVNIFKLGTYGQVMSGVLTVIGSSTGIVTVKSYLINMLGSGNTIAVLTATNPQDYSGGASTFTATDTSNTPVAGTNTISLNNTSGATCTFTWSLTIVQLTGTLTKL